MTSGSPSRSACAGRPVTSPANATGCQHARCAARSANTPGEFIPTPDSHATRRQAGRDKHRGKPGPPLYGGTQARVAGVSTMRLMTGKRAGTLLELMRQIEYFTL